MDSLFFHPKTVHLPLALGLLMPFIAGGLALAWWRQWLPSRAFALAVVLQAVLVASGFVSMQTGETEEHAVEEIVSHDFIEAHEEAAEAFVWTSAAVLAVMLAALVTARRRAGLPLAALATVGAVIVLALGVGAGEAGGELVYRHGAANVHVQEDGQAAPAPESHDEHDEGGYDDD